MIRISSILLLSLFVLGTLKASDQLSPAEQKLRDGLKNTMLQLRDAQTQVSTLQATQAENEQKIQDLTAQLDKLTKQSTADKQVSEKTITELHTRVYDQELNIAKFKEALEKWKKSYNEAAELARNKEAQRAKVANDLILLQRRFDDARTKNNEMFKLGNEILTRYERFGLGDAVTAREPFIGTTRIKFQNLVQDYQDKLTDQKIKP
ncbi:MAG: phage major capsid protein [Chthoniobacterales bacterium]